MQLRNTKPSQLHRSSKTGICPFFCLLFNLKKVCFFFFVFNRKKAKIVRFRPLGGSSSRMGGWGLLVLQGAAGTSGVMAPWGQQAALAQCPYGDNRQLRGGQAALGMGSAMVGPVGVGILGGCLVPNPPPWMQPCLGTPTGATNTSPLQMRDPH